jgi:ATP-dependent Clp protease ATP-binding subunit ClpA
MKKPLGDELLFGKLEHGGRVAVDARDGELVFEFTSKEAVSETSDR